MLNDFLEAIVFAFAIVLIFVVGLFFLLRTISKNLEEE